MKISLGFNSTLLKHAPEKAEIFYDTKKLINGHVLLMGKSGTGKTFTIRKFLTEVLKESKGKNLRVHIIDVHGDIDIEGAYSVKFSESTDYGFNPLIINPNKDFGGVRKRIQSFISSLNRTGFKLGNNQESMLRNLLIDLFAANGFDEKNPNTWKIEKNPNSKFQRKNPTIDDLNRFTANKMKSMYLGIHGNGKCVSSLEKVNKLQNKLYRKLKQANKASNAEIDQLQEEINKVKAEVIEQFTNYVNDIETGKELDDLLKYDSLEVMKSLSNKIDNLNNIGIFKNTSPPFDKNSNIWRYDIKALDVDEKGLFVSFLCEQLFYRAVQRGEQDDIVEIIVLDEAHLFIDDDPRNPINTIAKEARKFGLALFAASQAPTHFSEDFLSNVSTKIILGIDPMFWSNTINKLKLTEEALKWIVFHKRILIQMNQKGDVKNDFLWSYNSREIYEEMNRFTKK